MQLSTMFDWLNWIGSVHTKEIDLGLDRIRLVAQQLHLLPVQCPVVVVGGTNGKGSVVAGLESIYLAAGYKVGAFTSPFIFKHNEEVRVNRQTASDEAFCQAFARIEAARGEVTLTPFEYHTLAALLIFQQSALDVMLLEIGLGGRLDAVNVVDADVSIVTSIGIDHVEWLGNTREAIAIEKAGIFRKDKPAICGDAAPPATLEQTANKQQARFYQQGRDFIYQESTDTFTWQVQQGELHTFKRNQLLTQNMSTVLMAVHCLQSRLPVKAEAIHQGLGSIQITGRMQQFDGEVIEIFDVAHNPHAALELSRRLQERKVRGKTRAVFSMLADKDIAATLSILHQTIDEWYVAPLTCKRAASEQQLTAGFQQAGMTNLKMHTTLEEAYLAAKHHCCKGDRLVIFGSFYVVSELLPKKQIEF